MTYNISFDVAAILLLGVLSIALNTVHYTATKRSAMFRRYVYWVMINAALDIVTAYTIDYGKMVPDTLNLVLNTLYQFSSVCTVYVAIRYVAVYGECTTKVDHVIDTILGLIYVGMLTTNLFTGAVFSFRDGEYVHGPLFLGTYVCSFLIVIHMIVTVFVQRRMFTKNKTQFLLISFFLCLPLIFSISQIIVGNVLLTAFGEAFAALVMLFSLETPDYNALMKTMEELNIAKEEANIANRSKSDFLASMSHEIRTPINGILGMDTMILKECEDPAILDYAENIRTAGNSLLSIINDILDLSKIESGKMELVPVQYELFSILNDSYHMMQMKANEKGLSLIVENDPSIPARLFGDEVRIRQIINNFLSNAVKYTHEGTVKVHVGFELIEGADAQVIEEIYETQPLTGPGSDKEITSSKVESEQYINLVIRVSDTGIGIKEEDIPKLFQSFQRVDEVRNRNIQGTGLGLKISHQFISLMHGVVDVQSKYGEGTTFTAKIPQKIVDNTPMGDFAARLTESSKVRRDEKEMFIAPTAKILVVDDVKMNILVFKGLLKGTKIAIDMAQSGAECLEKVKETKYDLIFMDHLMPEMDGVETFHKLQESNDHKNTDTPVVVLTANALVGMREQYLQEGFADYLSKPVEQSSLLAVARKLLPSDKIESRDDNN